MHTEFLKGIAAIGVRRLGEKKPTEFGSETQIQKRTKVKKSGCEVPMRRESKRRRKA
jgi:hypothetical protein